MADWGLGMLDVELRIADLTHGPSPHPPAGGGHLLLKEKDLHTRGIFLNRVNCQFLIASVASSYLLAMTFKPFKLLKLFKHFELLLLRRTSYQ